MGPHGAISNNKLFLVDGDSEWEAVSNGWQFRMANQFERPLPHGFSQDVLKKTPGVVDL